MHRKTAAAMAAGTLRVPGFDVFAGVHPPESVLTRHSHERPTICAVQHGSFTEYYPGKAVACGDGVLKITPAGEPHWNRFDAVPTFGMRIDVDPARFSGQPAVRRILDERIFLGAGALSVLGREIAAEVRRGGGLAAVAAEGLLLELVARMARLAAPQEAGVPRWLRRADEIIHDLYHTPLTVASIAAQAGVHGSTLARAYRREYGCTIGQRIRALRIEHAARRLCAERTSITEIALEAGFYDQSHFTNAFRRHMGVTPAAHRREHGLLH